MQLHGRPIKTIAIDIDGSYATGLDISDFGYEVLRTVEAEGVSVVVVTGRCEAAALAIADRAQLATPVISCTGSLVTDPQTRERLAINPLADRDGEVMLELAEQLDLQPYVWDSAGIWTDRGGPDTTELGVRNFVEITPRPMPERWNQVVKMMVSAPVDRLDAVTPQLHQATALKRCLPNFFEASAAGFSKWNALELVLDRLGARAEETLGFGDGGTDIEWLGRIGFPIAVANAAPPIQDLAVEHIGSFETDAAARFLASLLGGDSAGTMSGSTGTEGRSTRTEGQPAPAPETRFTVDHRPTECQYVLRDEDAGGRVIGEVTYCALEGDDEALPHSTPDGNPRPRRVFDHTGVLDEFSGKGLASVLVGFAMDDSITAGFDIVPTCPYVKHWVEKHPGYGAHTVSDELAVASESAASAD